MRGDDPLSGVATGRVPLTYRWESTDLLTAPKMVEMKPEEPKEKGGILASGMTAEEEAELAELMSDED